MLQRAAKAAMIGLVVAWAVVLPVMGTPPAESSPTTALQRVLMNPPDSTLDRRYEYPAALLQRVLSRSLPPSNAVEVAYAEVAMSRDRQLVELQRGVTLQVMAEAPKPGWEEGLIPIRIPIRKGIQGYRLFLIHRDNQAIVAQVATLSDLQSLPTGSGAQWSTRRVLEEAGFEVVVSPSYEGLFDMLNRGRFVTFGRGLNEAFRELEQFGTHYPDLIVDESLALYIPLPTYFFVTPARPDLARQIETGLEAMIADGSFDQFFCDWHRSDIERARLERRRVFCVNNPNLSKETPLHRPELWSSPSCGLSLREACEEAL